MIEKFKPSIYSKSIFTINYNKLKKQNIKCIIFDLDNTIAPVNEHNPNQKVKDLIEKIKSLGFNIILASNSRKKRVAPFGEQLGIDYIYFSLKPTSRCYKKVIRAYNYKSKEVAEIGDQLVTDVFGANKIGIVSILVDPISKIDGKSTKYFNRKIEKIVKKRLAKKNIFNTGEYYE